jgi:hypothetical protein
MKKRNPADLSRKPPFAEHLPGYDETPTNATMKHQQINYAETLTTPTQWGFPGTTHPRPSSSFFQVALSFK